MNQPKKLLIALALVTGVAGAVPAIAADFSCSPTEVAVFSNRIHVKCSSALQDGTTTIWYWAVSTSDAQRANRFLSTASTALVSGRMLRFSYNPADASGTSFGCLTKDCRTPWAIAVY